MEEESLKERSAIRVQCLLPSAFLLNEKRRDLAEIESDKTPMLFLIQTWRPHYLVERLRDDHVEEEGEIPSYTLPNWLIRLRLQELPEETALLQHPQAAVKAQIQPNPRLMSFQSRTKSRDYSAGYLKSVLR